MRKASIHRPPDHRRRSDSLDGSAVYICASCPERAAFSMKQADRPAPAASSDHTAALRLFSLEKLRSLE
jgi:hypothetical protein